METKPRILYLLKILDEQTDEDHPLSTKQLIDKASRGLWHFCSQNKLCITYTLYFASSRKVGG